MGFPILLAPANPKLVSFWRVATGVTTGTTTGAASIASLVPRVKELIPQEMLNEQFLFMAVATGFITGLPLYFFPRVITLSTAQLGVATSVMLIASSVAPAFPAPYPFFISVLLGVVSCVLLVVFSGGLFYAARQKSGSDFTVSLVLLAAFLFLWVFCIFHPLR